MSAADIGQIRDVLITATEDFGPMGGSALQTTDQDQGKALFLLFIVSFEDFVLFVLVLKKTEMSFHWTVLLLEDTPLSSKKI